MTKISNKGNSEPIELSSRLLGTDQNGKTKNYILEGIVALINSVAGKDYIQFKFSPNYGSIGFFSSNEAITNPTQITKLFFNKQSVSKEDLTALFTKIDTLQNIVIELRNPSNSNNFATFKITNITNQTEYFELDVTLYKNFYSGNLVANATYSAYFDVKENFEDKLAQGNYIGTAETLKADIETRQPKVAGKSLVDDTEIEKLEILDATADINKPVSEPQENRIQEVVNNQIVNSTKVEATTSSPTPDIGLGNVHAVVGPGTYPNWGGMIVPANNQGTLQRIGSSYSVVLIPITGFDLLATKQEIKSKANLEVGKNLFNYQDPDVLINKSFGGGGTTIYDVTDMVISGFIPVLPSQILITNRTSGGFAHNYYNSDKNYVTSITTNSSFTVPSGVAFIRVVFYDAGFGIENYQLELGNVSSYFEPYALSIPKEELGNAALKEDFKLLNYKSDLKIDKSFSRNIFNKNDSDIADGFFQATGEVIIAAGYKHSGFIPVKPSTDYRVSNSGLGGAMNLYFDIDKNLIGHINSESLDTPSDCYFIRISFNGTNINTVQVEEGTVATSYVAYNESSFLNPVYLALNNKIDKEIGKNLINKNSSDLQTGKFYSEDGALQTNSLYNATGLIAVKPSTAYTHSNLGLGGAACVICNDLGVVIEHFNGSDPDTFITPSNGYFVKLSIQVNRMDIAQLEEGSVATIFSPFSDYAPLGLAQEKLPVRQITNIIPKKLYFIKNRQLCIYYENVLLKQLNSESSLFFDKGFNNNKLASFSFTSAVTNQTMNALLSNNLRAIENKNITYDVIDGATNNGKTVNALFIGDSFTDIGAYVRETKVLLEAQGVTFNLLGTCGNSTFKAEGLSGGTLANTFLNNSSGVARIVNVTGVSVLPGSTYPGTSYSDANGNIWQPRGGKIDGSGNGKIIVTKYGAVNGDFATFPSSGVLTKTSSSEFEGDSTITYSTPVSAYFNPFINHSTGVLDLPAYISYWGFANPNIIVIQFTWNDLPTWATTSQINNLVANFKTACDHIHSSYSSAKVVLSIEPYGSINGNLDWNGKKYSVLHFVEAMLLQFEDDDDYNSFVKVAPSYACVDLINGYGGGSTNVPCERYPLLTEVSGGDGVHPNTGMLQIADCIAPIISAII